MLKSGITQSPVNPALKAPWRIGVDVGGTFTDLVLVDSEATMHVVKVPSTPEDSSIGIVAVIEQAAAELGLAPCTLLAGCQHFFHASTVATNIVLERKADSVGMLVTAGFRDSIAIRRGIRHNPWTHRVPFPRALSPRYMRLPVRGRLDRLGREVEPLCEEDISRAAKVFEAEGVRSVAICLYNSFLNDAHERRAHEALSAALPGIFITLSSHIAPVMGEYERSSTAVLSAYVAPKTMAYLKRLAGELERLGLEAPVLVVQNNGGVLTIDNVRQRPVALLLSGPASAACGLSLYSQALGLPDLLSMEIGGTSCDATLISRTGVELASEFELGGYHVALPSIDVHSIGAGGGTIAGVDRAGLLFVGPEGAGADPGPAAYNLGGEEPTVTDAQLVLGRLKPDALTSGRSLELKRARNAINRKIALPLGLTIDAAAAGILRLIEQELLHAAQKITAERGHDPRRFVLVAAGGAGPMHGASVGRKLGSAAVYVPRLAGAFCALGMMNAPVKHEFVRAFVGGLDKIASSGFQALLAEIEAEAREQLRSDGFDENDYALVRELDLRHPGQIANLRIGLPDAIDIEAVRRDFLLAHRRLYGHADPDAEIEIGNIRVTGTGKLPPLSLSRSATQKFVPKAADRRLVFFEQSFGRVETDVYAGADLQPGATIAGPAIIEEATTTVVIGPNDLCVVDEFSNYLIRFDRQELS